ncbi:MAG TPA: ATP synthase subunit C [Anaerolineaceae bacterium]|nr:ATP synthase subunit C [Anaerolineaceae bacterium]
MPILTYAIIFLIGLVPLIPAWVYFRYRLKSQPVKATKNVLIGLGGLNVVIGLMAVALGVIWLMTPTGVQAAGFIQEAASDPYASLAAAISTGVAAVASGIAVSNTGSAALGTITEKPELFGQALIFVGLAEGIAIYGLLISFLILNR